MTTGMNEELLTRALAFAREKHRGQTDKAGMPYIDHPIRVAEHCASPEAKVVALLHDVIEDTDTTADSLRMEGFPDAIVEAVLAVTRRKGESYEDYIRRAVLNPIGREVKKADLEDNMDVRRLNELTDHDIERLRKYHRAWRFLMHNA